MARNDATHQRAPILAGVFQDHASKFEVPSADEAALIYSRDTPMEEWLARHVSKGG
jgi:hypothetical protein